MVRCKRNSYIFSIYSQKKLHDMYEHKVDEKLGANERCSPFD